MNVNNVNASLAAVYNRTTFFSFYSVSIRTAAQIFSIRFFRFCHVLGDVHDVLKYAIGNDLLVLKQEIELYTSTFPVRTIYLPDKVTLKNVSYRVDNVEVHHILLKAICTLRLKIGQQELV